MHTWKQQYLLNLKLSEAIDHFNQVDFKSAIYSINFQL